MLPNRFAYVSFDVVPAPKGAATHIMAFTKAIAYQLGKVDLITVAAPQNTTRIIHQDIQQTALPAEGKYLIDRVLCFQRMLRQWQHEQLSRGNLYDILHIRSIFEGFPLVTNQQKIYRQLVFEVNGLPSIELKYRYPQVAEDRDLLYKLHRQEQICLNAADLIITPSLSTKNYLQIMRQVATPIKVIPNGVDLNIFTPRSTKLFNDEAIELLYFGTLSAWQGVRLAIEAVALVNQHIPARLSIFGVGRDRQIEKLKKLASKLKLNNQVAIHQPISQQELAEQIHHSDLVLAPLTANDRNLVQGCCPLKILEAMASATPVVASDLPVVRELGNHGEHFWLTKPGSAKSLKDGILHLAQNPDLATAMARNARQQIENRFTWQIAGDSLVNSYHHLLSATQLV